MVRVVQGRNVVEPSAFRGRRPTAAAASWTAARCRRRSRLAKDRACRAANSWPADRPVLFLIRDCRRSASAAESRMLVHRSRERAHLGSHPPRSRFAPAHPSTSVRAARRIPKRRLRADLRVFTLCQETKASKSAQGAAAVPRPRLIQHRELEQVGEVFVTILRHRLQPKASPRRRSSSGAPGGPQPRAPPPENAG